MQNVKRRTKTNYSQYLGKVVAVEFLDHVTNGTEPIPCRIFGRVSQVKPRSIVVTYWEIPEGAANDETREANTEHQTLVSSCITSIQELVPGSGA